MISEPGVYEISEAEYHADPCPEPSLSSGIARDILTLSPLHAWHRHPRLCPNCQIEEEEKLDLGKAAHALILEGRDNFEIIDASDWRTKAAKEARFDARRKGKTALLAGKWDEVQAMADAVRKQCSAFGEKPLPLMNGSPEKTFVWQEDGVWCRARLDWVHDSFPVIDDLKTTAASANPETFTRTLFGGGYHIQNAFYCRGFEAVYGLVPSFRLVVVENSPPYAMSVVSLSPAALELGRRQVVAAIAIWRECLKTGQWPGYPNRVAYAELPPWLEAAWMEKELRDTQLPDTYLRAG